MINSIITHSLVNTIQDYFTNWLEDKLEVVTTYFAPRQDIELKDYVAKISVKEIHSAVVYITVSRIMLTQLNVAAGEQNPSETRLIETFNEIATALKTSIYQTLGSEMHAVILEYVATHLAKAQMQGNAHHYQVVKLLWRNQEITMILGK